MRRDGNSRPTPRRSGMNDSKGTIPYRSTLHLIQEAVGMAKLDVVATMIDLVRNDLDNLRNRMALFQIRRLQPALS